MQLFYAIVEGYAVGALGRDKSFPEKFKVELTLKIK